MTVEAEDDDDADEENPLVNRMISLRRLPLLLLPLQWLSSLPG